MTGGTAIVAVSPHPCAQAIFERFVRAAPRDTQVAISRLHTAASSAARAAAHGFLKSYSLVGTRGDADLMVRSSSLDAIQ